MIRSYRTKPIKLFATKGDASKLPVENADRVRILVAVLDVATRPEAMNLPASASTACRVNRSDIRSA